MKTEKKYMLENHDCHTSPEDGCELCAKLSNVDDFDLQDQADFKEQLDNYDSSVVEGRQEQDLNY